MISFKHYLRLKYIIEENLIRHPYITPDFHLNHPRITSLSIISETVSVIIYTAMFN